MGHCASLGVPSVNLASDNSRGAERVDLAGRAAQSAPDGHVVLHGGTRVQLRECSGDFLFEQPPLMVLGRARRRSIRLHLRLSADGLEGPQALQSGRRQLGPFLVVQLPSTALGMAASPLLEEERHLGGATVVP